jgi:hypothetical protein
VIRVASLLIATLLILAAGPAAAQKLDPAAQDALDKTLRTLLDPAGRGGEVAKSPQAAAADEQVRALAGSDALAQEFYALAGEILAELAQSTGGDTRRMLEAIERARTDPAGFAALLNPATQQRLRDLAVRLSDTRR